MNSPEVTALRIWASAHAPAGSTQARQVLWLLSEYEELLAQLGAQKELNRALAERVAAQSELLSRRAEPVPLPNEKEPGK